MDKSKRIFFKTEETVKKTKVGWMETDLDFKTFYHNAWQWVSLLNGVCSRDFLLWILSRIDDNNTFVYSKELYKEFVEDAKLVGTREYEESTVQLALREFLEKGMATKLQRGIYRLKPAIFYPAKLQEELANARTVKQLNQHQVKEVMQVPKIPKGTRVMNRDEPGEVDLEKPNYSEDLFSFESLAE